MEPSKEQRLYFVRSICDELHSLKLSTMTKPELINNLAARFPQLVARDAEMATSAILTAIAHTLTVGQRVEIRGFGSFTVNERPERIGRNPKTGDQVTVPAKKVPHFKAGKDMRERVDQSTQQ